MQNHVQSRQPTLSGKFFMFKAYGRRKKAKGNTANDLLAVLGVQHG